jgi:post-segregation antitoxin (ccd killing protein)
MDNADELVRWTVKVSKDTDVSLRSFLAQRGMKKGDLSKFIEQAVQKEVFAQTVADVEARNVNVSAREIEATIDDALRQVRAEMWGTPRKVQRTGKQIAKPAKRA